KVNKRKHPLGFINSAMGNYMGQPAVVPSSNTNAASRSCSAGDAGKDDEGSNAGPSGPSKIEYIAGQNGDESGAGLKPGDVVAKVGKRKVLCLFGAAEDNVKAGTFVNATEDKAPPVAAPESVVNATGGSSAGKSQNGVVFGGSSRHEIRGKDHYKRLNQPGGRNYSPPTGSEHLQSVNQYPGGQGGQVLPHNISSTSANGGQQQQHNQDQEQVMKVVPKGRRAVPVLGQGHRGRDEKRNDRGRRPSAPNRRNGTLDTISSNHKTATT
ncbi:unnamed protein product, partial [Amoebophrya sp. A25]